MRSTVPTRPRVAPAMPAQVGRCRRRGDPPATLPAAQDDLPWYFERRRIVERGDLAQVSLDPQRRLSAGGGASGTLNAC
jgi:hypothetical protein